MCVRESGGAYHILRVEVVAQGATLLVVLTDARAAPPPLRIDNYAPVAIMFHQVHRHKRFTQILVSNTHQNGRNFIVTTI